MKRMLLLMAVAAPLFLLGCAPKQGTAPKLAPVVAVSGVHLGSALRDVISAGGVYETTNAYGDLWGLPDGRKVYTGRLDQATIRLLVRGVNLQTVTIGKITVIYVCDYSMDFIGPPAPGHCRVDGTGCT